MKKPVQKPERLKSIASVQALKVGPLVQCVRCDDPEVPISTAKRWHAWHVCQKCQTELSKLTELPKEKVS